MTILAVTGHRPPKVGGYSPAASHRLCLFAHQCIVTRQPTKIITGMALGWDQACALGALFSGIPFIAAVPFEGQEKKWPDRAQQIYREILAQAERVVFVNRDRFTISKMHMRNEWVVDHSDSVLALWDGSSGGTAACVAYANRKNKPVENVWEQWKQFAV